MHKRLAGKAKGGMSGKERWEAEKARKKEWDVEEASVREEVHVEKVQWKERGKDEANEREVREEDDEV